MEVRRFMARLISAKEAQVNVAKYHESKYLFEEFSAYYEDNLVPVINDLIKEGSLKGHTETVVGFRFPDRFQYTDFNPLDWMQKQIEEAGLFAQSHYPDVIYWTQNWRKGGLSERRIEIIKEYNFYNQRYCGCEFSMR